MKNTIGLLISKTIVLLILVLSSACEIREAESRPDTTNEGRKIMQYADNNIFEIAGSLDKVLKVYNYGNTPDSLKETVRQKYLSNYGVLKSSNNTWYLKQDRDTTYTILTDGNSIYSINAIWIVKKRPYATTVTIKCIGTNKWEIKTTENLVAQWNSNCELIFKCTNSIQPITFDQSDFSISGEGILKSNVKYPQEIVINYEVTDSIKSVANLSLYKEGSLKLTGKDLKTNDMATITAIYQKGDQDDQWVTISNGKYTNTYKDWYYFRH